MVDAGYMFEAVGAIVIWTAIILLSFNVINRKRYNGICAVSWLIYGVGGFISHNVIVTGVSTAYVIWHLHVWWNNGGGDGTRRRLRDLKRRFNGVRRTAPATA